MENKNVYERFVGTTFSGRYRIEKLLGVGGMAVVFRADDMKEKRTVAIKMLKDEFVSDEQALKRFENESRAVAMFSHPNVVGIYDVALDGDVKYLVMEYLDGISLRTYMNKRGALTFDEIVTYSEQILAALEHVHSKGVVHRDIKPQNIMLLKNGLVKVTDFGIAKLPDTKTAALPDDAVGTVYYISPEQAASKPSDTRSDLYSLGVMMYEMATGKLPFDAEQPVSVIMMQIHDTPAAPRSINKKIPRGLETLILSAMEKDPKSRYQTALDMFRELRRLRRMPGASVRTPSKLKAAKRSEKNRRANPPSRSMTPVILGIAYALLFVAIVAAFYVLDNIKLGGLGKASITVPEVQGKTYVSQDELTAMSTASPDEFAAFAGSFGVTVPAGAVPDDDLITEVYSAQLSSLFGEEYKVSDYIIKEEYVYSLTEEKGFVMEQSPAAGSSRKPTCTIELTVSLGPEKVRISDYTITEWRTAATALRTQGFIVTVEREENLNIPAGYVISTDPAPGEEVIKGCPVTVRVSNGSALASFEVPDFVYLDEPSAVLLMQIHQMYLGKVTYTRSSLPAGTVLSQTPEAGAIGYTGRTAVSFLVSGGNDFNTNYYPDVYGMKRSDAEAELEFYGLKVKYSYVRNAEAADTVIRQSPDPAQTVPTDTDTVTIVISGGPDYQSLVPIYSVVGMDEETAKQMLFFCFENYASVDFEVKYERSHLPAGEVLRQDPAGRSKVDTASGGVLVTLTVSGGPDYIPPDVTVIMPDITGMTYEKAAQALRSAGILPGTLTYERSDEPADTVIDQAAAPDTEITGPEGMISIDLVISGGPDYTPDTPEPTPADPTA